MVHFRYFIILFFFVYWPFNGVEAQHPECPHAMKFNETIRTQLDSSIFWTKLYVKKEPSLIDFIPGFFRNQDLVRSKLWLSSDTLISSSHLSHSEKPNIIEAYLSSYTVFEEYAIFESRPIMQWRTRTQYTREVSSSRIRVIETPVVKFALIYIGANGGFRIFQTCDEEVTWIQISNMEMNTDFRNCAWPMDRFLEEALEKLDSLGINIAETKRTTRNCFPFTIDYKDFKPKIEI